MYNISLKIDNSTSIFTEDCEGYLGYVFLIVITTLFCIVGTPIHCWSLWVLLHENINPNSVFLLNISVLELLFCFLCLVNLMINKFFYSTGYKLSVFFIGLCWTVRPLLQIFMCIQHYLAVIHPILFLRYKGIQYRIALITSAWLTGVAIGLRLILIEVQFFPDHSMFLVFCIAMIIISFCCVSVLCALKRPGPGDRKDVEMAKKVKHKTDKCRAIENKQKEKAFRLIFHILVFVLICYIPLVIAYFMCMSKIDQRLYSCDIFPVVVSIAMIAVLISALFRMHNDGHLKHRMCFSMLRELVKGK